MKTDEEVKEEIKLQHKNIVGTVAQGRLGLSCITRELVQQEVFQQDGEFRPTRAVGIKKTRKLATLGQSKKERTKLGIGPEIFGRWTDTEPGSCYCLCTT